MRGQLNDSCQGIHGLAVESRCVTIQKLTMTPLESGLAALAAVSSRQYSDCQACCLECSFPISKRHPPQCHFLALEPQRESVDADFGFA